MRSWPHDRLDVINTPSHTHKQTPSRTHTLSAPEVRGQAVMLLGVNMSALRGGFRRNNMELLPDG